MNLKMRCFCLGYVLLTGCGVCVAADEPPREMTSVPVDSATTDGAGLHRLRESARLVQEQEKGKFLIAAWGDSYHDRPELLDGLLADLSRRFGDSGDRFITVETATAKKGPLYGHTVFRNELEDSDRFSGPAGPDRKYATGSAGQGVGFVQTGNLNQGTFADALVYYRRMAAGGDFRWRKRVDGEWRVWTTVSTAGKEAIGKVSVGTGEGVEIEIVSGSVEYLGTRIVGSGNGVGIFKCGNGGSRAEQHRSTSDEDLHYWLSELQPDANVATLGGNDIKRGVGRPVAAAWQDAKAWGARLLSWTSTGGNSAVLIWITYADANPAFAERELVDRLSGFQRWHAESDPRVEHVDLRLWGPSFEEEKNDGRYAYLAKDGVHLSRAGGIYYGRLLSRWMLPNTNPCLR